MAIGTAEGKGAEYKARGQAAAELRIAAGADDKLIPQWAEEGRRRAGAALLPPFSRPGGTPPRP